MQSNQAEGILKKKAPTEHDEHKHIQWDQQSLRIDALERGKCQKIDEPKTPYHQYKYESQYLQGGTQEDLKIKQYLDEANLNSIRNAGKQKLDINKLNEKLHQQMEQAGFTEVAPENVEDDEETRKKQQFQRKRKAHYNEFIQIQKPVEQSSGSQAQDA